MNLMVDTVAGSALRGVQCGTFASKNCRNPIGRHAKVERECLGGKTRRLQEVAARPRPDAQSAGVRSHLVGKIRVPRVEIVPGNGLPLRHPALSGFG